MKRNFDLIRKLALLVEADESGELSSEQIEVEGCTAKEISYHLELMVESGLLDAVDITTLSSVHGKSYLIQRLTNVGHDFIESARDDSIWNQATTTIKEKVGGATIEVLMGYLKLKIAETLGLPSNQ